MMFYQLPPVGNPICLSDQSEVAVASFFSPYQSRFYSTGTAALSAAIIAVIKQKNINAPEIILPAYACPDLISAIVYASAIPVLIDVEVDRPWLDLSQLSSAITENTTAIIGVNLFGISERWTQLREVAEQRDIVLIEDSAQYFPGYDETQDWQGDLVVLSFGRGKPVSLLGGGAVLAKNAALYRHLPKTGNMTSGLVQRLSFGLKARLYNAMISPFIYWLPQAMPFLHLGETRYHKLTAIEALDQVRLELLKGNISRYQDDERAIARCDDISSMLDSLDKIHDLPRLCNSEINRRLLRYPLLVDATIRDQLCQKLKQAGLGVSIMYPTILPKITGLQGILEDRSRFPNAELFASRILTLPTHLHVREKDIDKMHAVLKRFMV